MNSTQVIDEGSLHKYRTEVPNTVVRGLKSRGLSVYAKWLYVYLKSVAGDTGECRQGTTTLAAGSGISRAEVGRARQELLRAGLITIAPGNHANRDPGKIRIRDIWPQNMQEFGVPGRDTDDQPGNQSSSGQEDSGVSGRDSGVSGRDSGVSGRAQKKISLRRSPEERKDPPIAPPEGQRTRKKATSKPATDYTPGFLLVWQAYPSVRREGKVETFAIWQARELESRAEEIAEKIERLTLTHWAGREKKYIPMPQTWLNQARYEDDLVPLEVAQEQELKARLSSQEYRSMLAGQRFVERGYGETRQKPVPHRDDAALDGVSYRVDRSSD